MWKKPWKLKEGFVIGGGLVIIGLLLQLSVGPVVWSHFAYPVNVFVLIGFLLLVAMAYVLRNKVYAFRFLGTPWASVPALVYAVVLTTIMGLTKQLTDSTGVVAHHSAADVIGISRMLSFWPFVLVYVWMAFILGLTTLHRLLHLHQGWKRLLTRDLPFVLNHLGLLIALLTATLGNADMQRLQMTIANDQPEWRAIDNEGVFHELPLAIQLKKFQIDEYMPKLLLVNHQTGRPLGGGKPEMAQVEATSDGAKTYKPLSLNGWRIKVEQFMDKAQPVMTDDTTYYEPWEQVGATSALLVKAVSDQTGIERSGWLTCGSYMFPFQMLALNDSISLVMADREPQRFISRVEIFTKSKKHVETNILVNKPYSINGWKIYQLNYDTRMGRWSNISILELVRDPWLPFVYTGIIMLLVGALFMFILRDEGRGMKDERLIKEETL
ncbi:MAG: cytochrome c biogenesis protein ResB [Prevotella sp.]|nr:cytochrome c biogenesis protein ResB [Prevotella sp.]